ncbi:MAG: hypothetical protein WBQ26_03155 [Gemmatimonadaceae bacterium]|nr:hypothetical protein [Gemmatimonadaceae bacterium]
MPHQDRHIEVKKNQGWGTVLLTVVIVAVILSAVTYIHKTTYKSYNDLTFHAKGSQDNN